VFDEYPDFTAAFLQYGYGVHRNAFSAFRNGKPVKPIYLMGIIKAIFDNTPDDSLELCALLRALAETLSEG